MPALAHVTAAEVRVDGRADDPVWASVSGLGDFVTTAPAPGQPPTGATELKLVSDDRRLYALFVADDPEPDRVRGGLGRRDTRTSDDGVALYLDPTGLGQRAYVFGCTAWGVPSDGVRLALSDEDDLSWDARWDCAATRTPDGYVVELAIPWSAVRHPDVVDRIGVLASRTIARATETSVWPPIDPHAPSFLAQEAVLDGPGALPPSHGLDLVPDLTFGRDQDGPADDRWSVDGVGVGLTVRYAPSAALQVLGAVNPDFSQVESDAARVTVNRRYALDYEEKRPFFLEGQEWFDGPYGDLVYTRSMVAPAYGARATVEAGPWTVAALHALDRAPTATVNEGGGFAPEQGDEALDTVVRARCAIGEGSTIGVLGSDKELSSGAGNRVGVVDASIQVSDELAWTATIGASDTTGLGAGPAGGTSLTYGTKHFESFAELSWVSPAFRAENGFELYADRIDLAYGAYALAFPGSGGVKAVTITPAQGDVAVTTAGDPRSYDLEPELSIRLRGGWHAHTSVFVDAEDYAGAWLSYQQPNFGLGGPVGRWLDVYARFYSGTGPYYDDADPRVGHLDTAQIEAAVQVGPRLQLSVTGEADRMQDAPDLLPTDAPVLYAGFAGRAEAVAFATPDLWARLVVDRDSFAGQTSAETLLAWEHRPGTAIYAGGSLGWRDGTSAPASWAALTKLTWAFGL